MINWDNILRAAEDVARQMKREQVEESQAEKAGDYFVDQGYSEVAMAKYLQIMAENPPIRSQQSASQHYAIRRVWTEWQTDLTGRDKARAWGWAIRLTKIDT